MATMGPPATPPPALDALLHAWRAATAPVDPQNVSETSLSRQERALLGPRGANSQQRTHNKTEDSASCRPFDRAAFLARASTFSASTWFAKSRAVSAFTCARHGWRNVQPDLLYCPCCEQFLCFAIDSKISEAGVAKIADVFAAQLVTGHAPLCPWRGNPSPVEFAMLPLGTKLRAWESFSTHFQQDIKWARSHQSWADELVQRLQVADAVKKKLLDRMSGSSDDGVDASAFIERLMSKLSVKARDSDVGDGDEAVALVLCLLIVSGWEFDESQAASHTVAWCSSCNRRWSLLPSAAKSGEDKEETMEEPARKRTKREDASPVHLLAQHRQFCPWTDRQSPGDSCDEHLALPAFSRLPGWEQYCQAIAAFLGDGDDSEPAADPAQHYSPEESLHSIRSILDL